ncbi:MAG TPA: sugar ABC transporter ATP-binding protein [Bauldia sp.]|nr:sugar ABC transporter ATP-binding protein [Bauldia sp.]
MAIDSPAPLGSDAVVRLIGIEKSFGPIKVLRSIDLEFRAGEVRGLVGENGAGKSTVGKIIGGYYSFDAGRLEVFGEAVTNWTPRRALQHGIAMIHQELQLVPALSVADNVFLGIEDNAGGVLKGNEAERFRELDRRCNFGLDPGAIVRELRIADRQKVEIMRAIARNARVIIMDEPTSSLTADEAERLHEVIAWLAADGRTVIYVTHFLDHALSTCHRITVMRDGQVVRTSQAKEENKASLVEAMLGESADVAFPAKPAAPDRSVPPLLEVRNIATDTGLRDVSLSVRPGEIVGLIGLVGSGRSETVRAIFGADPITAGEILIAGQRYLAPSPAASVELGLVMIPEDRRKQGLVLTQVVRPNVSLPHLASIARWGVVRQNEERSRVKALIEHLGVTPNAVDGRVALYSGGNQQKVLLSKWMFGKPRIVLLDEPSRGVDIGARRRIHDFVVELAAGGAAVLLVSSEIEEVLGLSQRAYLMRAGRMIGEIDARSARIEDVMFRLFEISRDAQQAAAGGGAA